jgi:hypothetical protein
MSSRVSVMTDSNNAAGVCQRQLNRRSLTEEHCDHYRGKDYLHKNQGRGGKGPGV